MSWTICSSPPARGALSLNASELRARARIELGQAEVDRVGDVARPHVVPQPAGLEAAARRARHRRAAAEREVADRVDRVLADLVERERVERIEQVVAGAQGGLVGALDDHPWAGGQIVAPGRGRGERVGPLARRAILDLDGRGAERVVEGPGAGALAVRREAGPGPGILGHPRAVGGGGAGGAAGADHEREGDQRDRRAHAPA